jgi:small subunit ribosomal protein S6
VELRKYEIMLILPAEAEEPAVAGAVDRIAKILGQRGGEVTKVNEWGRRRFAHEIAKRTEGFYVVVDCTGEPESIKELDRVLHLADEVIRYKVTVRGEALSEPAEALSEPAEALSEPAEAAS